MRPWTSAAKWVLGSVASSANGTITSLLLFTRRYSSLEAVKKKKCIKLESESGRIIKEKSLFLCFNEFHYYRNNIYRDKMYLNQVVRPIRLSSYEAEEEEYLDEEAYRKFRNRNTVNYCTTFGSQIVFPNGPHTRQLYSIHTSTRPIKFPHIKILSDTLKLEEHPKIVRLGDVGGKLYRFDNYTRQYSAVGDTDLKLNCFEVFDPEEGRDKWRPLDGHPFLLAREYNVAYLEASRKILGWAMGVRGVFCFNTSKPQIGWTKVPPALGDTLPYLKSTVNRFHNTPLFIHNYHPDIGDFHLYFFYEPENDPLRLSAYYLSNNFGSFRAINNSIQLPVLCREYLPLFGHNTHPSVTSDFEFVLLGPQKVGLIINNFFGNEHARYKGRLLVVIFEYDIIVTTTHSEPAVEIQTRVLGTRRFAYHSKRMRLGGIGKTHPLNHINGAFWL